MKYNKLIVLLIIVLNVIFTAGVFFVFVKVGSEPTVLIGAWFTFTTGELWLLAGIKKKEVDKDRKKKGDDD